MHGTRGRRHPVRGILRERFHEQKRAGGAACAILECVTVTATVPASTAPLALGQHTVDPPVVLAPMAGITNVAFRRLCREQGAGLYVCEMVMTRALVERNPKTLRMISFGADEKPRSLQLYAVDPVLTTAAVRMIVEEDLADHIDLNF